jgi:DNA-binding GntR family transcriptional regulator
LDLPDWLARIFPPALRPDEIRSEIFFLGNRHHGEPLAGARQELKASGLAPERARLLRAVIARLAT